jgi:hypothetical protein
MSSWFQLDRRLGGPQSCSGCGGEEKNYKYNFGRKISEKVN